MAELATTHCVPCRKGAPKVTPGEARDLLAELPGWRIAEREGEERLEKEYDFPTFVSAMAFTMRVGEIAEAEGHHPAILVEWGRATVSWWTHAIHGLHLNDFVMAARTDAEYSALTGDAPA